MAENTRKVHQMIDDLSNELIGSRTSNRLANISFHRIEQEMMDAMFYKGLLPFRMYTVGSVHEGLSNDTLSDRDVMGIEPTFPMVLWESPKEGQNLNVGYLLAEQNPNEPAYLKIKAPEKCNLLKDIRDIIDKDGYLNSNDFKNFNLINLKTDTHDDFKIQGPSCMFDSKDNGQMIPFDVVYCLKCQSWPPITSEFFTRERPTNWPSQELLDKVSSLDCLVVAVGHPSTGLKDIEWRWSFSVAERELIHEMYAPFAKCMYAMKMLKKKYIVYSDSDKPTPFCSYFIKTACFWMCETFPHTSNIMNLIRKTLDWLIDCYQCRNLPHYFIPQQNLIGHLSKQKCDGVRGKLMEVKKGLWGKVMSSEFPRDELQREVVNGICESLNITTVNEDDEYTVLEARLLDHPMTSSVLKLILPVLHSQIELLEYYRIKVKLENDFFSLDMAITQLIDTGAHPSEILNLPQLIVSPIIEKIDTIIVPKRFGGVFKTRLFRYLGDVYTYLFIHLRNKLPHDDMMSYKDKHLEFYELGAEMVFTSQWSDHGVGGLIHVLKYHYLLGNHKELKETLISLEPKLADLKKKLTDFDPIICMEVSTGTSWQLGAWATDKLLHHLFGCFHRKTFQLHPIALALYINARVSLNEGDIENASNIVKEIKCLEIEIELKETQDILIKIIESLIGLLMVMRIIYF
ncbi:uncharacterized protein LOC117119631 [Anneissia japonica]|uniref:uncharacterized protein LOC117119631 n=1 Tax=Anneissia japonica TaxID=1529436 RepID=UPI0014257B1F|nr:uncharacterized protein LOC117119631 [Anneissia japonica]